jgi:hypothetical protein
MMKRFDMGLSLAVCFAAMIWGTVAHAEPVRVAGIGNLSCGKFIASIGKRAPGEIMTTRNGDLVTENAEYLQWLLGFVTGFNSAVAAYNDALVGKEQQQQVRIIDLSGLDLWMRNWCDKHPVQSIYYGGVAFIDEMRANAVWGNANRQ